MAPLATTDPTMRILLNATSIGFALSELSIRLRSARNRSGSNVDRGSIVAVVVSVATGVLVALWSSATGSLATTIPGHWVPSAVGLLMMWTGVALRQWAVWTLGRFFTVVVQVADGQSVVDRGPYRWVRHPSYTGLLLTLVGLGVALGSWLSVLALAILPSIGLVVRIRVEERALLAALGEPYREYAARHRRLVPGIW
jgi:protein-S-isoprenylcysteine O-methyltransferase Ste14